MKKMLIALAASAAVLGSFAAWNGWNWIRPVAG